MDIRCKLGCLLKRTMSPSSKWRSTISPNLSSSARRFLKEMFKYLKNNEIGSRLLANEYNLLEENWNSYKPCGTSSMSKHPCTRIFIRTISYTLSQLLNVVMWNTHRISQYPSHMDGYPNLKQIHKLAGINLKEPQKWEETPLSYCFHANNSLRMWLGKCVSLVYYLNKKWCKIFV